MIKIVFVAGGLQDGGYESNGFMSIEKGNPTPEEMDPDGLTPEQRELAESFAGYFADERLPGSRKREHGKETEKMERLLGEFESRHSLEALRAIKYLTIEDAPNNSVREPARKDLIPIAEVMNALEKYTDIPKERYESLKHKYMVLSKAVGIIESGSNRVRH